MKSQHDKKKTARIHAIYDQIIRGEIVNKQKWAEEQKVTDKTIQRHLQEIEAYLQELYPESEVAYDRKRQGHRLYREGSMALSDHDIFAVAKVLLDARAFSENEMEEILDHLLRLSYNRKAIEVAIGNERQFYQPVKHGQDLIERIWFFSQSVQKQQVLDVQYQKQDGTVKAYKINPLGLMFNEYFFMSLPRSMARRTPFRWFSGSTGLSIMLFVRAISVLRLTMATALKKVNFGSRFSLCIPVN